MANVKITDQEISAFSMKLQEWGKGLDAKEQALLEVLLKTASASMSSELPDADLDKVAGGTGFSVFTRARAVLGKVQRPGMDVMEMEHDMCGSMPGPGQRTR